MFEGLEHAGAASEDIRTLGMKSRPDVAVAILEQCDDFVFGDALRVSRAITVVDEDAALPIES
jgi:hypothetical protein